MTSVIAIVLVIVLLAVALLHVYWAFGGTWASNAVIPVKVASDRAVMPGPLPTLAVAVGLAGFTSLVVVKAWSLPLVLPVWLARYGVHGIAAIFGLRAIGEFNYVGFFKRRRDTAFARNDTRYYSPLCAIIAILCLVVALS